MYRCRTGSHVLLWLGHESVACSSMAATGTGSNFETVLLVVQSTMQAGKRKASALNGLSHSLFPDAAASVSQLDEQPESSAVPSSVNSGEESFSLCI